MITTTELKLIPSTIERLEDSLINKARLAAQLGVTIPASYPVEADAVPWFCQLLKDDPSLVGWLHFMIIHVADLALIGDGGFKGKPDQTGLVEIGYSIVPEYRGRGYATQVAQGLIDYAFAHPEVNATAARASVRNIGSMKVLERSGMKVVGEMEDQEEGRMWRWQLNRNAYRR
ncbi:MAG: GNAT family N-acetyltransferase [Blastocatellia bacterium]